MTYQEFKYTVITHIREFLPEAYHKASISIDPVLKNNGLRLDGLCIQNKIAKICPTIYLEYYFEQFQNGRRLEDILSEIARVRVEQEKIGLDIAAITDLPRVRDKIKVKLINAGLNAEFLKDKPHTIIADLAAVYYIDLSSCDDGGIMSSMITDAILSAYGITVEELHQIAVGNISENVYFAGMMQILSEEYNLIGCLPEDALPEKEVMYVLSTPEKTNGAGVVLSPKVMDIVAEKIGGDFFVLPSSIHELILVCKAGMDADGLQQTVRQVNSSIAPSEILSNFVYTYDLTHHELKLVV